MASIEKRTTKSGKVQYRVKVRLKGHAVQTATFDRLTDARRWEQQTEAAIREGRHFKTAAAKKHTLSEAIDRYIETVLPRKPKSIKKQSSQLAWWDKQIGHYLLSDMTPSIIAEQRDKLAQGETSRGATRSAATVNRYMAVLSHLFTIATNEWDWLETNPLNKLGKLKENRGRVRFLSDDERDRLLLACKNSHNKYLYLVVLLCLSTGARKMEILSLKIEDIDLERRKILLHQTKNDERRALPISEHVMEFLPQHLKQLQNKHKRSLIFPGKNPNKPQDIRASWDKAVLEAALEDFRFHDLRHSAASYLAMSGATLSDIAAILGHKTLQMVKRYSHFTDEHKAEAVEAMNKKIFGISRKDK